MGRSLSCPFLRYERMMIRKSILVTALLLLATVQTFAANCDLRCSSMVSPSRFHDCDNHAQMAHCHGMSMDCSNDGSSGVSGLNCGASVCRAELVAISKHSTSDELFSRHFATVVTSLLICPLEASIGTRSSTGRPPDPLHPSAPLDLRPGSSLRI